MRFYCLFVKKELCAVQLSVCHWALLFTENLFGPLELLQDSGQSSQASMFLMVKGTGAPVQLHA